MSEFRFYLGIHHPHWLRTVPVPVFVSHAALRKYKRAVPARLPGGVWALDSGAFSEISEHGRWTTTPAQYAAAARRYVEQIGGVCGFAAPMDWMCEPFIVAKTGLSVAEHQRRTVASIHELRALAPEVPFAPVLQGWDLPSYLECAAMYAESGIDLFSEPVVGLGSVCRRQGADDIGRIVTALADAGLENLHGFGVKLQGVAKYGSALASADSMAWSTAGRRVPGCSQGRAVKNEANCLHYALEYRAKVLASLNPWQQTGLPVFA
jgi:hypothetical protein